MASKQISGFGGSVTIDASTVVEVKEWNATINHENFDATHLQSSGYRDRKSLIRDFTGSFAAHEALVPTTSSRAIKLQLGSSGVGLFSLSGQVLHSLGINNPQDGVTFDHDFESTGPFVVVPT